MADVFVTRGFLLLAALRGVGEVWQGREGGLLLIAGAVLAWRFGRAGMVALAGLAWLVQVAGPVPSGSIVLIGWVALACALFEGEDRHRALWAVTVTVYAFAALNKLTPEFLSGQIIEAAAPRVPWPWLAAPAAAALELALAMAVWRRWWWAPGVAAAMHTSFVAGMARDVPHAVSLLAFNALMVMLVWCARSGDGIADDDDPGAAIPAVHVVERPATPRSGAVDAVTARG